MVFNILTNIVNSIRDHSFSKYVKFSKKLTFLPLDSEFDPEFENLNLGAMTDDVKEFQFEVSIIVFFRVIPTGVFRTLSNI